MRARHMILSLTAALALVMLRDVPSADASAGGLPLFAQAPPKTGGVTVIESKTYVVEAIVATALFGAAIFAVCRSSRRG